MFRSSVLFCFILLAVNIVSIHSQTPIQTPVYHNGQDTTNTALEGAVSNAATLNMDEALPMVHINVKLFWGILLIACLFGLTTGVVFTLGWRRQMNIDKFDSDYSEISLPGSRSSYQKFQPYDSPALCKSCPCFLCFRAYGRDEVKK
jgi:hypothetical protein